MIDELDQQPIRITEIEGARSVAMGFRFCGEDDPIGSDMLSPSIDIFGTPYYEADVMDCLDRSRFAAFWKLVECEVVLTGSEVSVLLIGHPFQFHAKNLRIEFEGRSYISDVQGDMTETH